MGRFAHRTLTRRRNTPPFTFSHFTNSYRSVFHNPYKVSANTSLQRYGWRTFRKKRRRTKRTFRHPDFDCFHSNSCWNGQSGRCSCRNFRWRSWCCFLDVGYCPYRFFHRFYRSNFITDL